MTGNYSTVNCSYNNSAVDDTVAFTTGADFTVVPGPLPLTGAGIAFGFSRRLRRRMQG